MEICTFNQTSVSNDTISEGYNKLEIKANHLKYPTNLTVIVQYQSRFLEVKVNTIGVTLNNSVLELSQKAAELLNIKHGENVPCQIRIPHINLMLIRNFMRYCCPYLVVYFFFMFS